MEFIYEKTVWFAKKREKETERMHHSKMISKSF